MSDKYPHGYRSALDKSPDSNRPRPGEDQSTWECPPSADHRRYFVLEAEQIDIDDVVAPATASNRLARLTDRLEGLDAQRRYLAEQDGKLAEERRQITEALIPDLMEEMGLDEVKTQNGARILLKETVHARLPTGEARVLALRWMEENGHGDLIKRLIKVQLGRGEGEIAELVAKSLDGIAVPYDTDVTVHNQTLVKFIRDALEAGESVPLELFGATRVRIAEVVKGRKRSGATKPALTGEPSSSRGVAMHSEGIDYDPDDDG